MARGNVRLARYLERFLESGDRRLAAAWRAIHKNPRRVGKVKLVGAPSRVEAILAHGIERLARFEPADAVEALAAVEARNGLGAAARARVARRIGLSFASQHEPRAIEWLWRVDAAYADMHTMRWRAAAAALHSRWSKVIEGIASMPDEERDRERWRYWRARALEETGRSREARAEFESLSRERDYYGFLAADRLETAYRFNHRTLAAADETVEHVAAMPAVRRALEFFELERRVDARREWHALIQGLDEEELKAASWIARCRNWHGRAILTIARTPERNDLELRFPVAYRGIVDSASSRRGLSPAMVYAFIRQESAFMPDAQSPAGALGLMQILPRTGRMLMRTAGRKWRGWRRLLVPDINVDLGTRYVQSLLSKTGGHFVLAAASYNAGPHRVRSWLPENGDADAAAWIDNIPFTETRRYVRRLLAYGAIYEHRLGRRSTRLRRSECRRCRPAPIPDRTIRRRVRLVASVDAEPDGTECTNLTQPVAFATAIVGDEPRPPCPRRIVASTAPVLAGSRQSAGRCRYRSAFRVRAGWRWSRVGAIPGRKMCPWNVQNLSHFRRKRFICHLRSSSGMRPGVHGRIAWLLRRRMWCTTSAARTSW